VVRAPHQVGQFLHRMRQRRPLGDWAVDVGGAEHRPHILPRERQRARNHEQRHVLGEGLGDARERVLDAGAGLRGEHAVAPAALDARVAVRDADADALLPAQDRPYVELGARLDQRVARIAGENLGPLAPEDLGNDLRTVHRPNPFVAQSARVIANLVRAITDGQG
jgi:hypothetical protein